MLANVAANPMRDTHGRIATDLRVSLTDRCNLRCTYCMPADGPGWLPSPHILTDDEVTTVVKLAVERLGITEVRFTGGEPLLRRGLAEIISAASNSSPRPSISLTTNGIGLAERAVDLKRAGLDRINISLDTLDDQTFRKLSRRDRLDDVLAGIEAAAAAGIGPIKLNSVLMRAANDHEAPKLLNYALEHGLQLRFIEQMPLDPMGVWNRDAMVTAEEILASLSNHWELHPADQARGSEPAERWLIDGGPATVGIVASVTRPFCRTCDRVRLTADGQIRSCLFGRDDADLRTALRTGASSEEIEQLIRGAILRKGAGHGINNDDFEPPSRPMSAIGG
ncbi:MAG: GTP 3',8-cyclase MoaA [Candidatus Nanopelagicales bacterium]